MFDCLFNLQHNDAVPFSADFRVIATFDNGLDGLDGFGVHLSQPPLQGHFRESSHHTVCVTFSVQYIPDWVVFWIWFSFCQKRFKVFSIFF